MSKHESAEEHLLLTNTLIHNINHQLSIHNWSLKILSVNSGISYETLKKLLNGKIQSPSFYTIYKLADVFHCSVDELAGIENPLSIQLRSLVDTKNQLVHLVEHMEKTLDNREF